MYKALLAIIYISFTFISHSPQQSKEKKKEMEGERWKHTKKM